MAFFTQASRAVNGPKAAIDCKSVVTHVSRGHQWATAAKRPYAGLWREIGPLRERVRATRHVLAHRDEKAAANHAELVDIRGNAAADEMAKEAARAFGPSDVDRRFYFKREKAVLQIARHLARTLAAWPSPEELNGGKLKRAGGAKGPRTKAKLGGGHAFQWEGDRWRCADCFYTKKGRKNAKDWRRCLGVPDGFGAILARPQGHGLVLCHVEGGAFLACQRCFAYGDKRVTALAEPCPGQLGARPKGAKGKRRDYKWEARRHVQVALGKGRHPDSGKRVEAVWAAPRQDEGRGSSEWAFPASGSREPARKCRCQGPECGVQCTAPEEPEPLMPLGEAAGAEFAEAERVNGEGDEEGEDFGGFVEEPVWMQAEGLWEEGLQWAPIGTAAGRGLWDE